MAAFTTNPSPARAEELLFVQFLDRSTGTVTSWDWDFGDGTRSSEQNPIHLYLFGEFDVSLRVTGPGGSSSVKIDRVVEVAALPPSALGTMPVPVPDQLAEFVRDPERAVELGKALFWDVQVGSDGLTACASCHFHAGVDNRVRNTLHPGANGAFEPTLSGRGGGPNTALNSGDFPFTKYLDPNDGLELLAQTDDRRGATGMFKTSFTGLDGSSAADHGQDQDDGLYQVGGTDALQVTGRDAPTTIGAIFYHRLFWDGRANHFFNGTNIWGNADPAPAPVLEKRADGTLGGVQVMLNNAAAASQAIGPPLSDVEMSWAGRSWPDLGRKMIPRRPLANQQVDPTDGVLGALAHVPGPGLQPGLTYGDMIQAAFHERWWGAVPRTADGHSQMEANFALFFGLAIQCYEATLIPDLAPFDRWRTGDHAALTAQQQEGLSLFLGRGRCITCHDTPMFAGSLRSEIVHNNPDEAEGLVERMFMADAVTGAKLTFATDPGPNELPLTFNPYRQPVSLYNWNGQLLATVRLPAGQRCPPAGVQTFDLVPNGLIAAGSNFVGRVTIEADGQCGFRIVVSFEWNQLGPDFYWYRVEIGGSGSLFDLLIPPATRQAVYDNGFYNLGVRPSSEDLGVGGNSPFGPLSLTRRLQNGEDLGQPNRVGPVSPSERVSVDGAFKTPTLRNVELTGPYMHNGSMATLEEVVEFYARGGDFADINFRERGINVKGFDITEAEKAALVSFLKSLTDSRVRYEQAPFDHPELPLKVGHVGDTEVLASDAVGNGLLQLEFRPATGAAGGDPIPTFAQRLPAWVTVAVVEETAASARIAFLCDREPRGEVRIRLRPSDPARASLDLESVVFTPADWRVTRYVEVTRLGTGSGPLPVTIVTSNAQSPDPEFQRLSVADVQLDFDPSTQAETLHAPEASGPRSLTAPASPLR